tara:strand:+ start:125 stop:325 length:201 start_codon:yes stop_codon:yes gene_type:complete
MAIQFKVINTPRHDRFEDGITELLNDGWILHGSPFVSQTGGMTQALTKEVKPSKKVSKDAEKQIQK